MLTLYRVGWAYRYWDEYIFIREFIGLKNAQIYRDILMNYLDNPMSDDVPEEYQKDILEIRKQWDGKNEIEFIIISETQYSQDELLF